MNEEMTGALIVLGLIAVWMLTKRWVWIAGLIVGGIASGFSALACIFHFQILGAMGFFALMLGCWFVLGMLVEEW